MLTLVREDRVVYKMDGANEEDGERIKVGSRAIGFGRWEPKHALSPLERRRLSIQPSIR